MKSLKKLRGFTLPHHHHNREKRDHRREQQRPPANQDELVHASQEMQDMRNCYDSLLSAAAATANSAFEFSEALHEMGSCLLEKTALNDDEDSGRVLLMLGKAQFELQNLVDSYRAHIIQTITTPSESLLKELQTVEEMKRQCDDKRDLYKFMLAAHREKGRSRNAKGGTVSSQKLQEAQEDYEEEATLFVFRLKSLKQGQSRSLLTQAARHHSAQLSFFRKAVKFLEAVEPHVKVVAEQQHIDYQFSGLEDDTDDDDDDYSGYDDNDDGELSFDYGQNNQGQDAISLSRNSTEEFTEKNESEFNAASRRPSVGSQSAPIFADKKFDPSEKIKEMRPSSTKKFHTYVLPTPLDAKSSASTGFDSSASTGRVRSKGGFPAELWHSSPLEPYKPAKKLRDDELSSPSKPMKSQSILKESNINSGPIKMPPPLSVGLSVPHYNPHTTDDRFLKRHAFSGPITGKTWSGKPTYTPSAEYSSLGRIPTSRPSVSPKVSPNTSPPPAMSSMSSPKINELHELPRPPISLERRTRPSSLIGHSAPLFPRGYDRSTSKPALPSHMASPLPTPPTAMARSFSIPSISSSQRMPISTVAKSVEVLRSQEMIEEAASPPLTPLFLKNIHPLSIVPESFSQTRKT